MKAIHWIIAAAALAFVQAAPASAGVNDPEVLIYRFPGVLDDGGASHVGVATVFHCTNFSGGTESIRLVTRRADGSITINFPIAFNHLVTLSIATHLTAAYDGFGMTTGNVSQGTTAIAATSVNVICTAMTIDAANEKPTFAVALRGIRFNPAPGSQE